MIHEQEVENTFLPLLSSSIVNASASDGEVVYSNAINTRSPSELQALCVSIEQLTKINQVKILRIFTTEDAKVVINENKNGIHINLTDVPEMIIKQVDAFLEYVRCQETELTTIEEQQDTNISYTVHDHSI